MQVRSNQPEIMDLSDKFYTVEEYNDCLYQIGRIGKYLGNEKKMFKLFSKYSPESILDIGCGGGNFTTYLAKQFKDTKVVGIDINQQAIKYAKEQQLIRNNSLNNLKFEFRTSAELNEPEKSYDILTTTLVLHHLKDEEIIEFLKKAKSIAKKAIIINDLHRNWIPYFFSMIIFPVFFNNRLVRNDSLLSIKKSFIYKDLQKYLQKASFNEQNYKISWSWPFRWIIEINLNN